ncbi:MAG: hypothetical protein VB140_09680 [Burkholderia sp.]|nr:MAG: hypothetical protein E5299_01846 [Burkholderia gladioli]
MRKNIHKRGKPKARYRVRNLAAYNEGLIYPYRHVLPAHQACIIDIDPQFQDHKF